MTKLKKGDSDYINNKELLSEVLLSKQLGHRTNKLDNMLILLAKRVGYKFTYNTEEDREDCHSEAIIDLLIKWDTFDESRTDNPFSYYTTIALNSYRKAFKDLYPEYKSFNKDLNCKMISINDIFTL